ncbi:uncharacterized protein XM38_043910 [Halomicronema hongdechloris C2206]|uniref:Uncharacterized protein n=2 Tax=Halomicronema hongdechloris TaxID=1209493 RepID=A0A1Z3HT02_9CYAN|nr:uncharacterized protein XM38_043910 [Halomicronema hongdechloris C2206]
MSTLNRSTSQRLQRLPKLPSVWEGDRCSMTGSLAAQFDASDDHDPAPTDCILWVDGTQGTVRSLAIVPTDAGPEAMVRTLLQAIEHPQGAADPCRPQKIVVRDRELQFYLRGVLQDLDITVDYGPALPLIDELFQQLQQQVLPERPNLPEPYAQDLMATAMAMWDIAPWQVLNEQQILAVEINAWEVDTLYVSTLGMAGVEYGLLLYRSVTSLRQFRQRVLSGSQSTKQMQEAFLEQDCLFLNFELLDADDGWFSLPQTVTTPGPDAVQPEFGSLHPLEGLRNHLEVEEAFTMMVALEALRRFFKRFYHSLEAVPFPTLDGRYRIENPDPNLSQKTLSVLVKTLPALAQELIQETEVALGGAGDQGQQDFSRTLPVLRDDYIPQGSLVMLTKLPGDWLQQLRQSPQRYLQSMAFRAAAGERSSPQELPVVLIQTSRPKAKTLIENLRHAQGIQAVCFTPGHDFYSGAAYELGLLQTGDDEFHLFAEYLRDDPVDRRSLSRWWQWHQDYQGHCGVVIAAGVTGSASGNPQLKDLCALFETRSCTAEELNIPPLEMQ